MYLQKELFQPNNYEHSAPAFSPDGRTVLWTIVEMNKPARLMEMTMTGNAWSAPHSPSFADTLHDDFYPFSQQMENIYCFLQEEYYQQLQHQKICRYGSLKEKEITGEQQYHLIQQFQKVLSMHIYYQKTGICFFLYAKLRMEKAPGKYSFQNSLIKITLRSYIKKALNFPALFLFHIQKRT